MERNRHIILAIGTLLAASLMAAPALAKGHSVQKRSVATHSLDARALLYPSYVRIAQNSISAAKAKAIARAHVRGGEVLDVSRKGNNYRVRVLKNGRVVDVLVDANTGRVKR